MRIIAGKCKGRKLEAPDTDMRPTLDRTKETLFNILQSDVPDAAVLDLFAGSGSLGLEAFSRGARKVVFADIDKNAVSAIKRNCAATGCDGQIITAHFETAIARLNGKFDIVFIDPPYKKEDYYYKAMKSLCDFDRLDDGAIVVCEHGGEETLPQCVGGLEKFREKKMGKCGFSFYRFSCNKDEKSKETKL